MESLAAVLAAEPSRASTLAWGCFLAGLILLGLGLWQRQVVARLVADGKRTTAHVAESALHTTEHHHLVWRFHTDDGVVVEHEDLLGALHTPSAGATARIIYDPADPHNARLETFAERTLAWALFFTSGVVLLGAAAVAGVVAA